MQYNIYYVFYSQLSHQHDRAAIAAIFRVMLLLRGFGGLVVSMLASGTQDRGFDPGRSRRIFRSPDWALVPAKTGLRAEYQ